MPNIKLGNPNQTIRLVNNNSKIALNSSKRTIRIINKNAKVALRHSGLRGPQGIQGEKGDKGDKGDTGVSTFVRAHHGSNPNVARPNALYVEWVGSVAPLNATIEDTWIDIS